MTEGECFKGEGVKMVLTYMSETDIKVMRALFETQTNEMLMMGTRIINAIYTGFALLSVVIFLSTVVVSLGIL